MHESTIMHASWPTKIKAKLTANDYELIIDLIRKIRASRAQFNLPDNKRTSLYIEILNHNSLVKESFADIVKLGFGTHIEEGKVDGKSVKVICECANVYLPMGEIIDTEQERVRLEKEVASCEFEIARSNKMLSNPGFIAKAPQKLVDEEKEKLVKNEALLAKLKQELSKL